MFPYDAAAATQAAVENTDRERFPPHELESRSGLGAVVQWGAGGTRYCCFERADGPDVLFAYGDGGVATFELDLAELRENLAAWGVLESDVDVAADELGWFGEVIPHDPADATPPELERLRHDAPFEYLGEYDRPGVRAVVNDLRERYRIGTAVAGEFGLGDDDLLRSCWDEDGLEYVRGEFDLGVAFLRSDAVVEFFEDATPEGQLEEEPTFREAWRERGGGFQPTERPELPVSFSRVRLERLDGLVAETLLGGGAYEHFEGDYEEAKALGRAFSHAFRDGKRSFDVTAYVGRGQWSSWFVWTDVWDVTILLADREADRIRLFAATCTD